MEKHIPAKTCYSHLGGKLGDLLLIQFIAKGWLKKKKAADKHYIVTPKGIRAFTRLGVDLKDVPME